MNRTTIFFLGWRWLRNSGHAFFRAVVCLIIFDIACTSAFASTTTGLDFPGSKGVTVRFRFLNPLPIYPATYIWRAYPRAQPPDWPTSSQYFYTTFFWSNDVGGSGLGLSDGSIDNPLFLWDSGSPNTYYGAHPFPQGTPDGSTPPNYGAPFTEKTEKWEIASDGYDWTGGQVVFGKWYTQAFVAWADADGFKHTAFYWDLSDPTKVITHVSVRSYGNTNPPVPALTFGDAPWHQGWEVYNGVLRGIRVYSTNLSLADIQSEANSPLSTAAGKTNIWYLNMNPTPNDISDKSGTGHPHDPSWVGSARPALFSETESTADNTPPATTSLVSGPLAISGWYTGPAVVTLMATDPDGPSDIASTLYRIDGGPPATYTSPFTVSNDGVHTIAFFSIDKAGNTEALHSITLKIDATPPVVTFGNPQPAPNAAGWNNTNVSLPFVASDNLSGVASISVPSPLVLMTEGSSVTRSVAVTDVAGNKATFTSSPVKIDKTPPEAFSQFDPLRNVVNIFGRDLLSGVPSGAITGTCVATRRGGNDDNNDGHRRSAVVEDDDRVQRNNAQLCTYTISDLAGNKLVLVARVKAGNSRDHEDGHDVTFQVVSTKYNAGPVINAPHNLESFEWSINKDQTVGRLSQNAVIGKGKDRIQVSAEYDSQKKQTTIETDKPTRSEVVKSGLVLLRMVTSKGTLSIEY